MFGQYKGIVSWQDYHQHCLPAIDDGSPDVQTSFAMLRAIYDEGVRVVAATPHYHPGLMSIEEFRERRSRSFESLKEYVATQPDNDAIPVVCLGAEVALSRGMADLQLPDLTYCSTNYILLELPYSTHESWVAEEVWNIHRRHPDLVVVFAHLERYLAYMGAKPLFELLQMGNCMVQVNTGTFEDTKKLDFLHSIVGMEIPIVLGTDGHNTNNRKPSFKNVAKYLKKDKSGLVDYIKSSGFLEPELF
jgi:protein-tyrosine phosphatase